MKTNPSNNPKKDILPSKPGVINQKLQSDSTSASFGDENQKLFLENNINNKLNLKNNIINKKFEVIQEILEISLMMLQQADKLKGNQINFLKVYLEKKGFVEMLNTIEGMDFGNQKNSELARNIRENFFK